MRRLGNRRQALLFFVAMTVPCAVLVALSLNLVRQERELAQRRDESERARALEQLHNDLSVRLERIRLDEFAAERKGGQWLRSGAYRRPETALVARVQDGAIALPWDHDPAADRQRERISEGEFGRMVRDAEQLELAGAELQRAAATARKALDRARDPVQSAHARLLYARVLWKLGRGQEATRELQALLVTPQSITDEGGVPLKLYAAERLLQTGVDSESAARAALAVAGSSPALTPFACDLLRRLLEAMPTAFAEEAGRASARVRSQIALMQQGEALRSDFPRLKIRADRWLLYGDQPWLVSAAPAGWPAAVIAVRAAGVLAEIKNTWNSRGWATVEFVGEGQGQSLGDAFPGVKAAVALSGAGELLGREAYRRQLVYLGLLLLVAATMFSAWLLWRDLRREVRMAELRSQFVSSVSHELKTPLTAIRMFAETLQLRRGWDEDKRSEYAATIVSECERLTRLVDDILAFSKAQQGQKTYRFRPVGLDYIVRSAVRAVEYPLAQQGFELRTKTPDELPRIRADADALEQALLNLLSNAMKYSGDSRTIELEVELSGAEASIRVRDHGAGIAPEHQARIFEQYYRAPTPENELVPGAGLGLALVAHIVKAHGGRIEVNSAPGLGSAFSIHLPLEDKA